MRRAAAAAVAFLLLGVACTKDNGGVVGQTQSSATASPTVTTTLRVSSTLAGRAPVAGFGQIAYRVSTMPAAGRCALLAETDAQHQQGLMNRTDLAGFDGMLFVFPATTTVSFWMKDTQLPLSVAYFDASGRFVSSADMAPCLGRGSNCPNYPPAAPYKFALEVSQSGLGALGIGAGATLTSGGVCS